MFGDQHLESLGGAQVAMRLQRKFLEKAGHTVTVVAPRLHARDISDAGYVDMPSIPITADREYSLTWPGRRTDRWVDDALAARPPADLVHVQADFWGAFIGHRFAERHGLPVVHTMHNRVDVGIEALAPFPSFVLWALNRWAHRALGDASHGSDGWAYLRRLATRSDAVTAPSAHFARRLEAHGAIPADAELGWAAPELGADQRAGVDVVWNGIDDEIRDEVLALPDPAPRERPLLVWVGRMSPEKRLLPFLEAVAASGIDADIEIIGGGGQRRAAQRLVQKRSPAAAVTFVGKLPYREVLTRLRAADALVQTSIGFETQGMTPFEAATLGTPSIVSDPDIAAELGAGIWTVPDAEGEAARVDALAETLREAVAGIRSGEIPVPAEEVVETFRQSSRTAAMIEVYERVRAERKR